jgi:hypothetical protein
MIVMGGVNYVAVIHLSKQNFGSHRYEVDGEVETVVT